MGLQVSFGLDSEISQEGYLRWDRKYLGKIFHELAAPRESDIIEGHLKWDHVPKCLISP